ncbi:UNVERIFIED_CONTAM: hypothetical protein FKN15_012432 [Acipenser sinensis]
MKYARELFAVLSWALAALMSSFGSSALSALGSLPLGSLNHTRLSSSDRAPADSPALRACRLSAEDSFCEGMSDSLGRSSCELNETFEEDSSEGREWRPPDSELIRRIHTQVESYLSDESLAEDAFLLKHVRRNRMGYVSIKLLTSFKKVRYLTRDWQTTLHALRFSEALVVNEEGTKVRRRKPVSESLIGIPPSKLLLAWNLPGEPQAPGSSPDPGQRNLMEMAMGVFGAHGTISSLRILRPGKELPSELKRHAFKYPELSSKVCALVEYEFLNGARKAYEGLRAQQCVAGGEGIKVVLLGGRGIRKKNYVLDPEESEDLDETSESKPPKKPTRKSKRFPYALEDSSLYSSSESDFAPASPVIKEYEQLVHNQVKSARHLSLAQSGITPVCLPVLGLCDFLSGGPQLLIFSDQTLRLFPHRVLRRRQPPLQLRHTPVHRGEVRVSLFDLDRTGVNKVFEEPAGSRGLVGSAFHIAAFQPDSAIQAVQRTATGTIAMGLVGSAFHIAAFQPDSAIQAVQRTATGTIAMVLCLWWHMTICNADVVAEEPKPLRRLSRALNLCFCAI